MNYLVEWNTCRGCIMSRTEMLAEDKRQLTYRSSPRTININK